MARTTGTATDLITFSRASSGTALTKVAYGPELVTNGGFDADSDWNKSTNWVISSGVASNDGTQGFVSLSQDIGVEENITYEVTFTVVSGTIYAVRLGGFTSAHQVGSLSYTAGTYTFLKTAPAGSNSVLYISSNNSAGSIDNISVKEIFYNSPTGTLKLISHPTNKPRVEYDANGVAKGLLIEEARTNLVTYSEDFTTSWTPLNATITSNSDVAPDGTATADTLLGGAVVDTHAVRVAITTVTSTQYAASCWFKKQNYSKCGVGVLSGTWQHVTYDFDADTLTTYGGATAKREIYGDFVRVVLLFSAGSTTTYLYLGPSSGYGVNNPFAFSAAGVEITFWGAQLEAGSFPTSYIPTSGATATRSADIASVSVSEFGYNQAQGSVVTVFSADRDLNSNAVLVNLTDGTLLNRMTNWAGSVSGTQLYVVYNNTPQASLAAGIPIAGSHKSGIAYATNDFALTLDAGAIQSDTSGSVPSVSQIDIGRYTNDVPLNGHIKSINYYPLRLSDAKLQSLTS